MNRPSPLHSAEFEFAAKSVSRTGAVSRLRVSSSQMPVRTWFDSISTVRKV
jgi:hypothetical protein